MQTDHLQRVRENLRNRGHESTVIADVDTERVGDIKQTLLQEGAGTVRNHTITFHLSETQTTVTGSTFHRLPGQNLCRSTGTGVDLVVDHVAQTLIVRWSQEHLRNQLALTSA